MYQPTVFVVDDDPTVCDSLSQLLESASVNARSFKSAEAFLEFYSIHMIGCLLLDVRLSGMSGLQLQEQLTQQKHHLPIIFMTGYGDVPMAVRAMQGGAIHFLEKPFDGQVMLDRVNSALEADHSNKQQRINLLTVEARIANLTQREREVMELVIDNHSNKMIAEKLGISIKTIEFHRSHMMEKMHAKTLLNLANMVKTTY